MLKSKKIEPSTSNSKEEPIDVAWLLYIGMNKLGYSEAEVYLMPVGKWIDLYEVYKKVYNFERTGNLYDVEKKESGSVMDL